MISFWVSPLLSGHSIVKLPSLIIISLITFAKLITIKEIAENFMFSLEVVEYILLYKLYQNSFIDACNLF